MCAEFPELVLEEFELLELSAEWHFQPLPMLKGLKLVMAVGIVYNWQLEQGLQRPCIRAENNDTTPVIWLGDDKPIPLNETLNNGFRLLKQFQAHETTHICTNLHLYQPLLTLNITVVLTVSQKMRITSVWISQDLWLVCTNNWWLRFVL